MRENSTPPEKEKEIKSPEQGKTEGYIPNDNPRANENLEESQVVDKPHEAGSEITDGEAG